MPEPNQEVVILGAGPAGLAAAVYAARAERKPLVLAGPEPGGQVSLTDVIENYPGFPNGVQGSALYELFQKQAERFGATVEFSSAGAVDLRANPAGRFPQPRGRIGFSIWPGAAAGGRVFP